jgi:hypothetical protein
MPPIKRKSRPKANFGDRQYGLEITEWLQKPEMLTYNSNIGLYTNHSIRGSSRKTAYSAFPLNSGGKEGHEDLHGNTACCHAADTERLF